MKTLADVIAKDMAPTVKETFLVREYSSEFFRRRLQIPLQRGEMTSEEAIRHLLIEIWRQGRIYQRNQTA